LGTRSNSKYSIEQPNDLNQLSLAFEGAFKEGKPPFRVVFDSMSDILLYSESDTAIKFMQVISAKVKKFGGVGLFTLEQGMHDDKFIKTFEYLTDGIVEMDIDGDKRFIKIKKMAKTLHTLVPIHFKISKDMGLGIELSEFFK
jgi:KaiC/GvpD/RAD55 family RecA-like ATPase